MRSSPSIAAIILGAGSSRRLGRPKQTLPLDGHTVLGRVVAAVNRSSVDRTVLVVGGAADEALALIDSGRAVVAHNSAYGAGCASSLLAGLDAAGEVDGILMVLGDMPTLTFETIDEVVGAVRVRTPWGAIASYRGRLGHPVYFSRAAFPELRSLHGDKAVWRIIDDAPTERMIRVDVDDDLPPDIDTWDDYLRVRERLGLPPVDSHDLPH